MCLYWDIDSSKKSIFVFEDKLFLLIQNTQNYIEKFSLLNELLPLANLNDSIIHVIYIIQKYSYIFVASKMKRNVKNEAGSLHVSWNIFDRRIYFVFCCTQKKLLCECIQNSQDSLIKSPYVYFKLSCRHSYFLLKKWTDHLHIPILALNYQVKSNIHA